MRGSYNPREKPYFSLVNLSAYLHGLFARIRRYAMKG